MKKTFIEMIKAKWQEGKFVCIGLDIDLEKVPSGFFPNNSEQERMELFAKRIIKSTLNVVCCYKINSAFYEAYGSKGMEAIQAIISYIKKSDRQVNKTPVILDYKRADIGNTNEGYAKSAFSFLDADAVTVNPYLGSEAMKPFLECRDKGIIVLCRTSNLGASELQDVHLQTNGASVRVFEHIAITVRDIWNYNNNCLMVVGATVPEQLKAVRSIVPNMPLLIPGVGAQGGTLEDVIENGLDDNGEGVIINNSRGVLYASDDFMDFTQAARKVVEDMNKKIKYLRRSSLNV